MPKRSLKSRFILLLIGLAALYLFCNLKRDFWYPDEPDVAEITREMLHSGEWIHLTLSGHTFSDYPHLLFWIAGICARVGGMNEFMLRLPSTVSALGILLLIWFWVRRAFDEQVALWSCAVLGTTYFFVSEATHMHVDMMFSFFFTGSLLLFRSSQNSQTAFPNFLLALLASLSMGLASLTKGPAGLLLPTGILGIDAMIQKRWRELIPVVLISVGGVVVFLGWSVLYAHGVGKEDLFYFIFKQNIDRFLSGWSHRHPVYYYFINLWPDIIPWSLFFIPAGYATWKEVQKGRRESIFLLIWFTVVFLFFTISRSKRNVYILPLYPAVAIMVGNWLKSMFERVKSPRSFSIPAIATAGLFFIVGVALIIFLSVADYRQKAPFPISYVPVIVASVSFLVAAVWIFVALYRKRTLPVAMGLAVSAAAIYLVILGWFFPTLDNPLSGRDDAEWVRTYINVEQGEAIGIFAGANGVPNEATTLEYYGRSPIHVLANREEIQEYLHKQPGDYVLVRSTDLEFFQRTIPATFFIRKELTVGSDILYAVEIASFNENRQ